MCRMESSLTLPRVVRGAEKLRSGYEVVGLQPTGHGSPGQRLCRCQGYYGQFADSLELLRHFHMLVFAPNARCLMAGDRVGNPLGNIAGEKLGFQVVAKRMVRCEVFGVAELNGVTSMVRIFDHAIHPFVYFARDIGTSRDLVAWIIQWTQ